MYVGHWRELSDGRLVRIVYVPRPMVRNYVEGRSVGIWFSRLDRDEELEVALEDELSNPRPQNEGVRF